MVGRGGRQRCMHADDIWLDAAEAALRLLSLQSVGKVKILSAAFVSGVPLTAVFDNFNCRLRWPVAILVLLFTEARQIWSDGAIM